MSIAHMWRSSLCSRDAGGVSLPLRLWASLAYPGYAIGVVLLILVEVPATSFNGSQRGSHRPLTLQPSG